MRKALEALIRLQDIDWQLKKISDAKGDLPQKVESLTREVEEKQASLEELKRERDEKLNRKNSLEGQVDLLRENLKKYQTQLYQVKTNREYDAITLEIDETQEKIDNNEFEVLEIEEAVQELGQKIEALEGELKELHETLAESKRVLDEMMAQTQQQEEELMRKREEVLPLLSRPILNHYERIRSARGGMAIAILQNGSCSGCSSRIPPQRAMEIRTMNDLYLCEVCGRILVWRPEQEAETSEGKKEVKE